LYEEQFDVKKAVDEAEKCGGEEGRHLFLLDSVKDRWQAVRA
jgi:hypothetical protein